MRLDHGNAIGVVGGEVAKVNNQLLDHSRRTNSAISVQTDTLHTIRDDLQDSMKKSETNWNQSHLDHRQTISVLHRQSDYMQSTDQRIKDISNDASSRWEESRSFQQVTKTALERQAGKLDAMEASSKTQSNRSDAHHQATIQGVASVNDKLANLSNLSSEQFSVIIRMLQQIESAQTATGENATTEATGNNDNGDGKKELSETIDRLCLLAEEDGTVHSSEAQSIIEDLEHVLDVLSDFTSSSKEDQRKRKRSDNDGNEITLPDVKRMRGLLTSASAVALNPKGLHITFSVYQRRF